MLMNERIVVAFLKEINSRVYIIIVIKESFIELFL